MKYKGYELLKAIADKEIKEGSKIILKANQDIANVHQNGFDFKCVSDRRNIIEGYADTGSDNDTFESTEDEIDTDSIAIEKVMSMLKEKEQIIDLMSEIINNNDIDEDICKQMGQKKDCNEFEDKEKCKECIKQYFENKAKEVK